MDPGATTVGEVSSCSFRISSSGSYRSVWPLDTTGSSVIPVGANLELLLEQVLDALVEHGDDIARQAFGGGGLQLCGLLANGDRHGISLSVVAAIRWTVQSTGYLNGP